MTPYLQGDPLTLRQRLVARGEEDPLLMEAADRIRTLEQLCAQMTDTGVILERDVIDLVRADTWWLPEDGEVCYTDLQTAMEEIAEPGEIVEWARAHTLENAFVVSLERVVDASGAVVEPGGVREFLTYEQAEEALAANNLQRRRVLEGR